MDNETFHACQLAIQERIKAIDSLRNSPQSDRAGLVQMGFALRLLARRYIKAAEWPGHEVSDDVRLGWELEWYMNYLNAIAQVCKTAQLAVREKRLTLRNQLTRTPLYITDLEAWLNMDIDAALTAEANEFFPGVLKLRPAFDAWPDVLCIPPGSAYVQDIATWAAGDGLASVDDALSLLTGAVPAQTAATPAPVEAVSASDDVQPDKAGPLPLTTGDIAFCFAGLRCTTEEEWKTLIGKGRDWLERCLVQPGTRGRGGAPKLWNPVFIGAALVRDGHVKPNSVRAKFQTQPLLKPWLDEWKTYEADNLSAD